MHAVQLEDVCKATGLYIVCFLLVQYVYERRGAV